MSCSPTGRRPRPCSPAPLLCDSRQQRRRFGDSALPAPGTTEPRSDEVPQGRRLHLRAQGSALVFFDLRRNRSPGSWRTCGRLRRCRRSAVRGSGSPPVGATGLACSRLLPCGVVAIRNRECSFFVQGKAHDSPAESGFWTADRPENRVGNTELVSGSGEISRIGHQTITKRLPMSCPIGHHSLHCPLWRKCLWT